MGDRLGGPLAVLADLWSEPELTEDLVNSFRFILELRDRLAEVSELAAENLRISSKYKTYFDLKCSKRKLTVGDEVLMLKPEKKNKLQMIWSGPYKVVGKKSNVDYYVDVDGNTKLYHINLLKHYFRRDKVDGVKVESNHSVQSLPEFDVCKVNVIEDDLDMSSAIITVGNDSDKLVNINDSL